MNLIGHFFWFLVFNLSHIVLFQTSDVLQQFHFCFLNSTNNVVDFILGINSQYYDYIESLIKEVKF